MTVAPSPLTAGGARPGRRLAASVVVCAYTLDRWDDLSAAIDSLRRQTLDVHEVVLVIDHEDALLDAVRPWAQEWPPLRVVPNAGPQGLSGARNTGVAECTGDVVFFLDDDAAADERWIEHTLDALADETVIGVGGWVEPRWDTGAAPEWFPEPFGWVVGCSYTGLPTTRARIRNPIGAAMAFRRRAFELAGEFSTDVGRVGSRPLGCEETEFSIRVTQADPTVSIVVEPAARVRHHVTAERATPRYFVRRCWYEGRSKRAVAGLVGAQDGLSSERSYVLRVLPAAVLGGLARTVRTGRPSGVLSALAVVAGLVATAAGYLFEAAQSARTVVDGRGEGPHG